MKRVFFHSFTKSQLVAIASTVIDFICLILFVELFAIWYVTATAVAAAIGASVNFLMGRYWSFVATEDFWHKQAIRYLWVSMGSLGLNTLGVFVLTENLEFQYLFSKILTAIAIGIVFNYPLHRFYVFKSQAARVEA